MGTHRMHVHAALCSTRWGLHLSFRHTGQPQVPALNIFESSFRRGKFDESRKLSNGKLMEFAHIYPMDAVFDTLEDVPEEVSSCTPPLHAWQAIQRRAPTRMAEDSGPRSSMHGR